jgi:hypothetical protein
MTSYLYGYWKTEEQIQTPVISKTTHTPSILNELVEFHTGQRKLKPVQIKVKETVNNKGWDEFMNHRHNILNLKKYKEVIKEKEKKVYKLREILEEIKEIKEQIQDIKCYLNIISPASKYYCKFKYDN